MQSYETTFSRTLSRLDGPASAQDAALTATLGDDLSAARRLLSDLESGRTGDPGTTECALQVLALAPTLMSRVDHILRNSNLSNSARDALERFLECPIAAGDCLVLASSLLEDRRLHAALAFLRRYEQLAATFERPPRELNHAEHELGYCLSLLGRHEEALRHLSAAAHTGADAMEFICIGHTLIELGRMREARDTFARAMRFASHPAELRQAALFVRGAERLMEFEGQTGGLDARDLHYVHTGGVLLQMARDAERRVRHSGYHGGVTLTGADEVAPVLDQLRHALDSLASRRPTCVVPLHNTASPVSLAIAELLDLRHFSHLKAVDWDRPLVVATRLRPDEARDWDRFMTRLPDGAITFALALDWTAEHLPAVDVAGLMASTCHFYWERSDASDHRVARELVSASRAHRDIAGDTPPNASLLEYYARHKRHRLAPSASSPASTWAL